MIEKTGVIEAWTCLKRQSTQEREGLETNE